MAGHTAHGTERHVRQRVTAVCAPPAAAAKHAPKVDLKCMKSAPKLDLNALRQRVTAVCAPPAAAAADCVYGGWVCGRHVAVYSGGPVAGRGRQDRPTKMLNVLEPARKERKTKRSPFRDLVIWTRACLAKSFQTLSILKFGVCVFFFWGTVMVRHSLLGFVIVIVLSLSFSFAISISEVRSSRSGACCTSFSFRFCCNLRGNKEQQY
eukprot:COSAG06_NODE_6105_length_3107_cov_3.283910_2_plen_208_part_00